MKRAVLKPELKLGAEPKKMIGLGVLLVILVAVWLLNRDSGPAATPTPAPRPTTTAVTQPMPQALPPGQARLAARARIRNTSGSRGMSVQEFRPTLKPKEPIDTAKIDPTLHLDMLAKVRNAKSDGGSRNLFDLSKDPPPTVQIAKVAPIHPGIQTALTTGPTKPVPPPPPAPPPPPPAIPLKFYGYTNAQRTGPKRAFFLEGEDIYVAGEGDTIKNRYKIIRIGVNSAVVEDTQFKNQQTLPLIEEMANT